MSKRKGKTSFQQALKEAQERLTEALKERVQLQKQLGALDAEIPALQQTIYALQRQVNPDGVTFRNSRTGLETTPSGKVVVPGIPPELAAILPPQDLTGMGSIPAIDPNRDDALPEIEEGTDLLEKKG